MCFELCLSSLPSLPGPKRKTIEVPHKRDDATQKKFVANVTSNCERNGKWKRS